MPLYHINVIKLPQAPNLKKAWLISCKNKNKQVKLVLYFIGLDKLINFKASIPSLFSLQAGAIIIKF